MSPEHNLWTEVLMQAIYDIVGFKASAHRPVDQFEAKNWFLFDGFCPGSFRWVCNVLDLDPVTVRHHVFNLSAMQLKQRIQSHPINYRMSDT